MIAVRDVMRRDVVRIWPEMPLAQLASLMAHTGIGYAAVLRGGAGGRLAGLISAGDLLAFLEAAGGGTQYSALSPQASRDDWGDPVPRDFLPDCERPEAELRTRLLLGGDEAWIPLAGHSAAEIMTPEVADISPDAPAYQAAELMDERGVRQVLVIAGRDLKGLVTACDLRSVRGEEASLLASGAS